MYSEHAHSSLPLLLSPTSVPFSSCPTSLGTMALTCIRGWGTPLKEGVSCCSRLMSLLLGSGEECATNTHPKPFSTLSRSLWGSEEPLTLRLPEKSALVFIARSEGPPSSKEGGTSMSGFGPALYPLVFSALVPSPKPQSQPQPQPQLHPGPQVSCLPCPSVIATEKRCLGVDSALRGPYPGLDLRLGTGNLGSPCLRSISF